MRPIRRHLLHAGLALALGMVQPMRAAAEDIDLFVGSQPVGATGNPNVLVIIDNSSNWSAASQHWSGGVKQGQSELRALASVVLTLDASVNLGLMMLTAGSGSNPNGGYVRYAMRTMTDANKAAFLAQLGFNPDGTLITACSGNNSLTLSPNCMFQNFDNPGEKIGSAASNYSAALFDAFKYFGGYTSPAHAQDGIAGTPVDSTHFGPIRYSGNPDPNSDPGAYTGVNKTNYVSPLTSCSKNYIILVGNGFPSNDTPASLLSGVGGDTRWLSMQQYSTTTTTTPNFAIGTFSDSVCRGSSACATAAATTFPGFTNYACANGSATGCTGSSKKNQDVTGTKTVIAVTPTSLPPAPPANNVARYADEWAKYLFTTDVSSALGQQNVTISTIDVFKDAPDANQTALLNSMAKAGGGTYYQASSEDDIKRAFQKAMIEVLATNSVFASASLPINATNRSQNENQVFIGMFRPDAGGKPRWYGNLKRYQVATFGNQVGLADKDGNLATSIGTGFIDACATSFWTTDTTSPIPYNNTTDSSYWRFSAISAGICKISGTSPFSDLPDGPQVEKGAVGEVLRKGNDPSAATPTFAVNRTMYTCASTSSCSSLVAFNSTNVSAAELGVSTAADQQAIIDHTLGKDVNDENGNTDVTEVRSSVHGDVAHSRPLPVNYGGSTGVVIYYGANDGTWRAVSGSTGKERWSFIAPEHHLKLKRLRDDAPIITYPTTPILIPSQKKDYFFDGSAGVYQNADNSSIWIFPTMRRGGRMIYAFDVTTVGAGDSPDSPVLKWRVGCPNLTDDTGCTSGLSEIGQTWSFPNVGFIKGYSTSVPAVVVGGGYDACEDADTATPSCGAPKGNKVYILDANTGALVRSFSTLRSVVGDVTLIDRDFDGLVDQGYLADSGGNLYRVDFVDPFSLAPLAPSNWTITKIAFTDGGGRKFLFAPAALAASDRVYLAVGSGDREHPLQSNYPYQTPVTNRFYMYIDKFGGGSAVDLDGTSLDDFTSNNSCTTALGTSSRGWRIDLNNGRGEQVVTSSVIFGGLIFFSTNMPTATASGSCDANLGQANGYALNLLNASGAVGTSGLCGAYRSGIFAGGGLPPSPVTGTVPVNGVPTTIMIGGIDRTGGAKSPPLAPQNVKPTLSSKRSRLYWYLHE